MKPFAVVPSSPQWHQPPPEPSTNPEMLIEPCICQARTQKHLRQELQSSHFVATRNLFLDTKKELSRSVNRERRRPIFSHSAGKLSYTAQADPKPESIAKDNAGSAKKGQKESNVQEMLARSAARRIDQPQNNSEGKPNTPPRAQKQANLSQQIEQKPSFILSHEPTTAHHHTRRPIFTKQVKIHEAIQTLDLSPSRTRGMVLQNHIYDLSICNGAYFSSFVHPLASSALVCPGNNQQEQASRVRSVTSQEAHTKSADPAQKKSEPALFCLNASQKGEAVEKQKKQESTKLKQNKAPELKKIIHLKPKILDFSQTSRYRPESQPGLNSARKQGKAKKIIKLKSRQPNNNTRPEFGFQSQILSRRPQKSNILVEADPAQPPSLMCF